MRTNYTQEAKERCLNLIDSDIKEIWADIETLPNDSNREKWKKKLQVIATEYTLSGRFALMRIFQKQANVKVDSVNEDNGFDVAFADGTIGHFADISAEHSKKLSEEELALYERLMLEKMELHYIPENGPGLIHKALHIDSDTKELLSRDEALELGHALGLKLEEMEWFLLRVFNNDSSFRYNSSDDLIDAYVFLRTEAGKSGKSVETLKQEFAEKYRSKSNRTKSKEVKTSDWTLDMGSSLPEQVRMWSADDCDEQFMRWIGEVEKELDYPSETALRIYRNLAAFAYYLTGNRFEKIKFKNPSDILQDYGDCMETELVHRIRTAVTCDDYSKEARALLFENGEISKEKCDSVAGKLLLENQQNALSDFSDKSKAWHVFDVNSKGEITVNGVVNASRTRVRDILFGKETQIDKSDLLYLLWYTINECWIQNASISPNKEEFANRLFDFIDLSELCLDAAGLPAFYPPHLMEQSMMLSIVYSNLGPTECDPTELYETICSYMIKHRNRKKND